MEPDAQSHDQVLARARLELAQQELDKGHLEKAEECAKEAVEFDNSFNEARLWLADLFIAEGEPELASRQLQDAIYTDRTDKVAWEKLREVDPLSAARMARLSNLAPDPFVANRNTALDGEFEDLVDETPDEDEDEEFDEGSPWAGVMSARHQAAEVLEDFDDDAAADDDDDDDVDDDDPFEDEDAADSAEGGFGRVDMAQPAMAPRPAAPAADTPPLAVPVGVGPTPTPAAGTLGAGAWEYEQDRDYLHRWQAEPKVAEMVKELREVWQIAEHKYLPAYDHAAHLQRVRHPEIADETDKCLRKLGLADCELLMVVERGLYPVPVHETPPRLIIPTTLIKAMSGPELEFHLGRSLEYIRAGYLAEYLVAECLADRPLRALGDETQEILRAKLHDLMGPYENFLKKEEKEHLIKLAHAWQQRATLSADRAGWLCCGDVDSACLAIAKATTRSLDEAAKMTLTGFLDQFKGEDPGKLAAIPPKDIPDRSPSYAAYRIQMLRWWTRTPAAAQLRQQFAD